MTGTVIAGTQPIVGSTLSLWSTGTSVTQVSISVTTDSTGTYSVNYTCPSAGALMYVTATGGHVGAGAANSKISLTSALGACGSMPTSAVVNELTTAAAAYALSGFASAAAAPATVQFSGKSPGLDQAFNTLSNLTVTSTGAFESTGPETNKTTVQQTLDTLANAMAACNASSTPGSCTELFSCATPGATFASTGQACTVSGSPTLPTDTLSAALAVTQNAGTVSMPGIFDVGTINGNPFTPVLTASPNDWTLPLVFTLQNFGPLAIDAAGHIWILTDDPHPAAQPPTLVVAEFDAAFNLLSTGQHYFNGGGITSFDNTDLSNLAIDGSGNVWIGGGPSATRIVELNSLGAAVSPANGFAAGSGPNGTAGVAIDSSGDPWFASGNSAAVFELNSAGAFQGGNNAGYSAGACPCIGIAPDAIGDVWVIGSTTQYLAEISSTGAQSAAIHPPGTGFSATFYSIAADGSGNLWLADQHNHGIWEYTPSTTTWSVSPFANVSAQGNPSHPKGIAIDGAGHKWVANQSVSPAPVNPPASSLTELSADGSTNLSPDDGFGSGAIAGAYSVAIDGSGNVWVADGGTTIVQFVGAAAPTKNPIATAVKSGSFTP